MLFALSRRLALSCPEFVGGSAAVSAMVGMSAQPSSTPLIAEDSWRTNGEEEGEAEGEAQQVGVCQCVLVWAYGRKCE